MRVVKHVVQNTWCKTRGVKHVRVHTVQTLVVRGFEIQCQVKAGFNAAGTCIREVDVDGPLVRGGDESGQGVVDVRRRANLAPAPALPSRRLQRSRLRLGKGRRRVTNMYEYEYKCSLISSFMYSFILLYHFFVPNVSKTLLNLRSIRFISRCTPL